MFGKVNNALIRREADTYRAQGLHEEALSLFRRVLASSVDIPPDARAAFETQIRQIEAEMAGDPIAEASQLSEEYISVIRQGWCESASAEDLLVCAQSFHAMGCFHDALEEFRKLFRNGYARERIMAPMADCLVHTHEPEALADSVRRLAEGVLDDPVEVFGFQIELAEEMLKGRQLRHAAALGRRLAQASGLTSGCSARRDALVTNLKSAAAGAGPVPPSPAPVEGPAAKPLLRRIAETLGAIASRLRRNRSAG